MIHVCEPLCEGFSHEKFNSSFIYQLRLAYPSETISFYGEKKHVDALKSILAIYDVKIDDICYNEIPVSGQVDIFHFLRLAYILRQIINNIESFDNNTLLFFSFDATLLFLIKAFSQFSSFQKLKYILVCHGLIESLATKEKLDWEDSAYLSVSLHNDLRIITIKIIDKLSSCRNLKSLFIQIQNSFVQKYYSICIRFYGKYFPLRRIMYWKSNCSIKYVLLSHHIKKNILNCLDTRRLRFYDLPLPTFFKKPCYDYRHNEYPKFAVFGYGNLPLLRAILKELQSKNLKKPYEIRLVSMATYGLDSFPNIVCPSPGKLLKREQMESLMADIDMQLILYPRNRYRLSCSGSIYEAMSLCKPILHFENDCINAYNTMDRPIGMCATGIYDYTMQIVYAIQDYSSFCLKRDYYVQNILEVRKQYSLHYNSSKLEQIYED